MPISIKEKFLKSTAVVSIFTMLSRIFGYIRDALMFIFISNASGALDAFFVAFRIPNFFRRIFGEGALSTAYIPVLSDYKNKDDQKEVKEFINTSIAIASATTDRGVSGPSAAGVAAGATTRAQEGYRERSAHGHGVSVDERLGSRTIRYEYKGIRKT